MGNVLWSAALTAFFLGMLALDLGVFHHRPREISRREAAAWSAAWIALSCVFGIGLCFWKGSESGVQFFTGYILEKSLSFDNLFMFTVIFDSLAIPPRYQHRTLSFGVLGAIALRAAFIAAGVSLLAHFRWVLLAFGALILVAGIRLLLRRRPPPDPRRSQLVRWAQRFMPMAEVLEGSFFVRRNRQWLATPLLLALVMIEFTDMMLAVDSIPAIFSVTRNSLIVYSSTMFAVLGLRSLYFLVADFTSRLRYLRVGLGAILIFAGAKMLVGNYVEIPALISLVVVCLVLLAALLASLRAVTRDPERAAGCPKAN